MSPAVRSRVDGSVTVNRQSGKIDYETPPDVFDPLDREFGFTLDAAASPENSKVERYFTIEDDALSQPWDGVVWLNPPYGHRLGDWIRKARREAERGATVVALIPANTDTSWWHDDVMPYAEVRFIRGRIRFVGTPHRAPCGLAIVIWRPLEAAVAEVNARATDIDAVRRYGQGHSEKCRWLDWPRRRKGLDDAAFACDCGMESATSHLVSRGLL